MHIALLTSKNEEMVRALYNEIRKQYPSFKFSVEHISERGHQLKLEGDSPEEKPMAFTNGFTTAWSSKTNEVK